MPLGKDKTGLVETLLVLVAFFVNNTVGKVQQDTFDQATFQH